VGQHGKHRPLVIRAALIVFALWAGVAQAACRQALALGLDVSGSVDAGEYDLQMQGVARALADPDVLRALGTLPEVPVHLAIFEWSGPGYQRLIVPWQPVTGALDVAAIAQVLQSQTRTIVPPTTGLGTAMQYGAGLMAQRPNCWRHTLDISGDGKNNAGPHPQDITGQLAAMEVNALVIGVGSNDRLSHEEIEVGELTTYFQTHVIRGPNAFTQVALGYDDYARALRRKLLRELAIPNLSLLSVGNSRPVYQ